MSMRSEVLERMSDLLRYLSKREGNFSAYICPYFTPWIVVLGCHLILYISLVVKIFWDKLFSMRGLRTGISGNSRSLISPWARNSNPNAWNTVCPSVRSPGKVPLGTTPAEMVKGEENFWLFGGERKNCALTRTSSEIVGSLPPISHIVEA